MKARVMAAVVLAAGVVLAPAAQAHEDGVTVIATGLDNPRGLAFAPDGSLYVAEGGRGGSGPCIPGAEGGDVCFGASGAITKISKGYQKRVVTGLPSLANPDGTRAIGPSDVAAKGDGIVFTIGLGLNPATRAQLPADGHDMATLRRSNGREIADLGGFEATVNPDGGLPDTNPTSVVSTLLGAVVADAGGNSLVRVAPNGKVSTLAVFPDTGKVQAVPTGVVRGPDGAFYVGQLTGFPFVPGSAKVFRVVPGHKPEVFADGFTNIIDVAFGRDGSLYVLEITQNGMLSGDPSGALIKVDRHGTHRTVLNTGLITPAGLAIKDNAAYVSNFGTAAGAGTVVRVPLH